MPAGEPRRALGTLIQRSARKVNSPKFASRIVHKSSSGSREDGSWDPSCHTGWDYMLWWRIKIR
jgi:hypothetical protein